MSHRRRIGTLSYYKASVMLAPYDEKKLCYETWLVRRGEDIVVRHFRTDILTFHKDGTCTIDPEGYHTNVTMSRINDMSPASVWSYRGERYLYVDGEEYEFFDGIRVKSDGRPVDPDIAPKGLEVANEILGAEFKSLREAISSVDDLKVLSKMFRRRFLKHRVLIYCDRKFLPAFLGRSDYADRIISERLKEAA